LVVAVRNRLTVVLILGVGLVFALLFARQLHLSRGLPRQEFENKKLRVLTYSTFVSATGPGGEIFARFKSEHGCELEVVTTGDAGLLLERLRLTQGSVPFDVVIGLDQFMLNEARAKGEWKDLGLEREEWAPAVKAAATDPTFVPFDWSPMTFIYREGTVEPPHRFEDLLEARFKRRIALQDPHLSSPGLQFYNWVSVVKGEAAGDFLRQLRANAPIVSPSWALSYGLFKKRQADLVFSYVTSLAFHWGVEKDHSYRAAVFPEGHPLQIEYVGVPASCRECDLAKEFVRTLLQPDAQRLIMEKNFMFPVLAGLESGTIFTELPKVEVLPNPEAKGRDLSDWDKIFKR
jgi:thiamine transport system substrate-binding protein